MIVFEKKKKNWLEDSRDLIFNWIFENDLPIHALIYKYAFITANPFGKVKIIARLEF